MGADRLAKLLLCTECLEVEERMMDFFCQTLKQNYGKADGEAVATLVEGLSIAGK